MTALFLRLVNLGIAAGWLVLAVLVLRLLLRRAPKRSRCILWALVAVRLMLPFSIESVLSLLPSAETIPPDIALSRAPAIHSGLPALNSAINPVVAEAFTPAIGDSANPLQVLLPVLAAVWLVGAAAMLIHALVSFLLLRRRVDVSLPLERDVYLCDGIASPFLMGVARPRIYLPSGLTEEQQADAVRHERAHLARRDHWWKPLGYLLLTVYWFHPLLWLGYVLFCRDVELACDERVLREMTGEEREGYARTLLDLSRARPVSAACPLAFGETGVKERVKASLRYRKPALWIILAAVLACAVTAVCFLTGPLRIRMDSIDSVTVGGIPVSREAAEELVNCLNSHRRGLLPPEEDQHDPTNIPVRLNCGNGDFYLVQLQYYSGYSFHPLHFGEDDYRTILSFFDADKERWQVWRMDYDTDEEIRSWLRPYLDQLAAESTVAVPPSNALIVRYDPGALTQEDLDALGRKHGFTAVKNFGRGDLFSAYYDVPLTDQTMNGKIRSLLQEAHILDAIPGEIPARTEAELREKCPEYFDLDVSMGLEVYVWQMAPGSYSCGLLPRTAWVKANTEIWGLCQNPVGIGEMRTILESYDMPRENIIILPARMPFSSYFYVINDEYRERIRTKLFG